LGRQLLQDTELYGWEAPQGASLPIFIGGLNPNKRERTRTMSIGESVKVALFIMALVFVLLAVIYVLIKLSTAVIRRYFNKPAQDGR
jgi:hypothetical protein